MPKGITLYVLTTKYAVDIDKYFEMKSCMSVILAPRGFHAVVLSLFKEAIRDYYSSVPGGDLWVPVEP